MSNYFLTPQWSCLQMSTQFHYNSVASAVISGPQNIDWFVVCGMFLQVGMENENLYTQQSLEVDNLDNKSFNECFEARQIFKTLKH